jgi:spermidine/putrescine transport system ATP-binding protein
MMSGFETPTKGEIFIGGKSMAGIPAYRRPTNLVFQQLSLFPHMNVSQNIGFGLEMKGFSKNKIKKQVGEILDLIEMTGFENRRIDQLSGGQQQRVAIARALVNRPTAVLLDEPLGALDLKLRNQMQLELKRIQRDVGTTFVYVTHDQGEAITMSDRIAVMNRGCIEQEGKSDDIYENPQTVFVANFIGETNLIKGRVDSIEKSSAVILAEGLAVSTDPKPGLKKGQNVVISVRPEKIRVGENLQGLQNIFKGQVTETIYQGLLTQYQILVEKNLTLTVKVQNMDSGKRHFEGDVVKVGWSLENGVLITDD